jgi:hypothetical protein
MRPKRPFVVIATKVGLEYLRPKLHEYHGGSNVRICGSQGASSLQTVLRRMKIAKVSERKALIESFYIYY